MIQLNVIPENSNSQVMQMNLLKFSFQAELPSNGHLTATATSGSSTSSSSLLPENQRKNDYDSPVLLTWNKLNMKIRDFYHMTILCQYELFLQYQNLNPKNNKLIWNTS